MTGSTAVPAAANQRKNYWKDASPDGKPDVLNRESVAKDFTNILLSLSTPAVIGIDAAYGMGKSFFVERWHKDLKQAGHTTLFFNAWENDFSDDPFMALIVELSEQIKATLGKKGDPVLKGLLETAGRIGAQVVLSAITKTTHGLLDVKEMAESEETTDLKKRYGDFSQEKIEAHLAVRKGVKQFKERLQEFARLLKQENGDKALPVIVFIDELDRCRPDFAVQLLENIKHIFSTQDFIFVLSMDRTQLQHAVGVIYGQGMDGEGYLRRFIDLDLVLPEPKSSNFIKFLFESSGLDKIYKLDHNSYNGLHALYDVYTEYADFFKLTLREQQQTFKGMEIALRRLGGDAYYPYLLGFMAPLKAKHKKLYESIGTTLTDPWELIKTIEALSGRSGDHFQRFDKKGKDGMLEFLLAFLEKDFSRFSYYNGVVINEKNALSKEGKKVPEELERKCKLYERVYNLAKTFAEEHGFYDRKTMPIVYVKQILDIGASYTAP